MGGRQSIEQGVAERFSGDVKEHQMTVLREDGLYRHLRFSRPRDSVARFDIITWPGYLAFVGDMGDYVFARLPDMLKFFRGSRPNLSYWAEKVQAADKNSGVKEFSEDRFREVLRESFDTFCESRVESDEVKAGLWDEVESTVLFALDCDGKDAAFTAARDLMHEGRYVFPDFWDNDFNEYTYRFVWCCHALQWAVRMYDAVKAQDETVVAP